MTDDHYIFVFVRQDISIPEQLVHSGHAAWHAGNREPAATGVPNVVIIGIPHLGSLAKVVRKLKQEAISYYLWHDTDTEYGPTVIVTQPLTRQEKDALKNYRLYSLGTAQAACGVTADEGANADVAQLREHSLFKRGVAGENPVVGSSLSPSAAKECL